MGTPMVIHLYGEDNEVEKTVTQNYVPWKLIKDAVKLQKVLSNLKQEELKEEDVDAVNGLVLSVFQGKLTPEELDRADFEEILAVVETIQRVASGGIKANPTPPGK